MSEVITTTKDEEAMLARYAGPARHDLVDRRRYQITTRDGKFIQLSRPDAKEIAHLILAD